MSAMIDDIRAAAEFINDPGSAPLVLHRTFNGEERKLRDFALEFFCSGEVDEQWLRETWGFKDYGTYRIANLDWRGPLITYWTDSINGGESRLSMSDSRLSMNRGQFTALMFSLGQYPK